MGLDLVWSEDSQESQIVDGHAQGFQFIQEHGVHRASKGVRDAFTIRSQAAKSREKTRRERSQAKSRSLIMKASSPIIKPPYTGLSQDSGSTTSPLRGSITSQEKEYFLFEDPESFLVALLRTVNLLSASLDDGHIEQDKLESEVRLLIFRGRLLRAVQKSLRFSSWETDSTLAGISVLILLEGLNGDVATSWTHVHGLESLVGMDRHRNIVRRSSMLKKLIIWAVLCNSTLSLRLPKPFLLRIEGDELCQGLDRSDPEVVSSISDYEAGMRRVVRHRSLSREAAHILCYLRRLSKACTMGISELHAVFDAKGDNYLLEHLENRTARLLLNIQAEVQNPATDILHFFCLSANIYMYAVLRKIPLKAPYFSIMVARLHKTGMGINFKDLPEPMVRKGLWMFLVGRLAAHERPEQKWFEETLRQVTKVCGLDKEDMVKTVFRQLLWPMKGKGLGFWRHIIDGMDILNDI